MLFTMSYSRRVHSISLQIYVLFLLLQSIWPVFFIIFASKVQIVFAKSISESVEEKGLTFFLDCRTAEHIMEGCFIPYFSVN